MATKHGKVATYENHMTLFTWSSRSNDRFKALNLHYNNVYSHQMSQGVDIPQGDHIHKVICHFHQVYRQESRDVFGTQSNI